jgi:hypothetical protein
MKRFIRSDKPVTFLLLFWSHKCDLGAEPRSRIIATSAVKGLKKKGEKRGEKRLFLIKKVCHERKIINMKLKKINSLLFTS